MLIHVDLHASRGSSFEARVRAVPSAGGAFTTLTMRAGDGEVTVYLPSTAYQAAKTIADLWPTLGDPAKATPKLSSEALALVGADLAAEVSE